MPDYHNNVFHKPYAIYLVSIYAYCGCILWEIISFSLSIGLAEEAIAVKEVVTINL